MKTKALGLLLIINAIFILFLGFLLSSESKKDQCECALTDEKISTVCLSKILYKLEKEN